LALLLCAEAPGEPLVARQLVADTVAYRMRTRGQFLEQVMFAEGQYEGVVNLHKGPGLLDPREREREWQENLSIARRALWFGPRSRVSHFCRYDVSPSWAAHCEWIGRAGEHQFYLCVEGGE
jgi:hypothetical protein